MTLFHRLGKALLACFFTSLLGCSLLAHAQPAVVTTPQVRAELMAYAPEGVVAGQAVWVGLELRHQPGWHSYWKNAGDSGLPTTLDFSLPEGVMARDTAWPIPQKITLGSIVNYGYDDTVLLPVPLIISSQFKPSALKPELVVKLKASWLVCRTECIPQEGEFSVRIPVRGSTALNARSFEAARLAQPQTLRASPASKLRIEGQSLTVAIDQLPTSLRGKQLDIFPETSGVIEASAPWQQSWRGDVWTASLPIAAQRDSDPARLAVVLTSEHHGWRTSLPISGTWPAVKALPALTSPTPRASAAPATPPSTPPSAVPMSLLAAMLGALLGGLILNLMPCVFPVLAIKLMSFGRHAEDARSHRLSGLAYSVGVVLSFVALGVLLLSLRAAGESLGWGFQLQNPLVVATLAALFTLIGLNFAGMFEFGQFAPSSLAALQLQHPVLDAFLTGVLTVAVASPCSAPFMGASLGLAITLPAAQGLLIFASLGLGLALPFLLASMVPAVARALPRPGPWMAVFRQFMAFPMFATVVWLVWVLGQQSGIDGAGALMALLVIFSALIWSFTHTGRTRLLLTIVWLVVAAWAMTTMGPNIVKVSEPATSNAATERWQTWSAQRVAQAVSQDQLVFVDFTAAWCVSCQYNKKTTLSDPGLLAALDSKHVVLLRADWTRRDAAITKALAELERNGVPVYVFYKRGQTPVVLSEILSVDDMQQALAKL